MHYYIRNLLILSYIATLNLLGFVFFSGRSTFFFGRSSIDVETSQHSKQSDILRHGSGGPTAEKNVNKSKAEDEFVNFKNTSNGTVPETTKLTASRPPVIADSINTLKQNPTVVHTRPSNKDLNHPKVETPIAEVDNVAHVNPHNYQLIIDEPRACYNDHGKPTETFLVVLITTTHRNVEQRQTIRETWGSQKEINGKKIVTLFLLGYTKYAGLQKLIEEESKQHHDVLQEDFVDSYNNLTLKTVMGMKWFSSRCSHASYFMKTDDDVYVGYANLVTYLSKSGTPKTNLAFGALIISRPNRDPESKWFMPKETYPGNIYPPFLSGTGYVLSADIAGKVYKKSLDTGFFYIEDVFVAICLKSLKIVPKRHKYFQNWRTPYSYCTYRQLITAHKIPPTEMTRIWKDLQSQHSSNC